MLEFASKVPGYLYDLYADTVVTMGLLAILFTGLAVLTSQTCNPRTRWWRNPGLATDICYVLSSKLLQPYMSLPLVILLHACLSGIMSPEEVKTYFAEGRGPLAGIGFWWQLAIFVLGMDLMSYWAHRIFHGHSLWRFHAIHHSSTEVDWTSSYRFHPINIMFGPVLAGLIMLTLGISPKVMAFVVPFEIVTSVLVHANLNWTFGPLKYVFASPVFHRWHHTGVDEGGSQNFSATFSFLDYMFGTFYMPEGKLPAKYGVDDPNFPESFLGQLLYPFKPQQNPSLSPESAAGSSGS